MPSPADIFGSILFGSIGLAAVIYGKKSALWKPMLIGVVLMVYPYFVSNVALMLGIGAALVGLLYLASYLGL